jgi:hypothetical protein
MTKPRILTDEERDEYNRLNELLLSKSALERIDKAAKEKKAILPREESMFELVFNNIATQHPNSVKQVYIELRERCFELIKRLEQYEEVKKE